MRACSPSHWTEAKKSPQLFLKAGENTSEVPAECYDLNGKIPAKTLADSPTMTPVNAGKTLPLPKPCLAQLTRNDQPGWREASPQGGLRQARPLAR